MSSEDVRSFNVGASDYSQHKYQSWDFWLTWCLNPFDADLSKRILRTKATDGRLLDYQKIKHICGERIRQLESGKDHWKLPKRMSIKKFEKTFNEMIADYTLTNIDVNLMRALLLNYKVFQSKKDRIESYRKMQSFCEKAIKSLEA